MTSELVARLRAKKPESDGPNGIFMVPRNPEGDAAADEIERLTAQLAEARESERAAVVAYLRSEPTKNWTWKALAQSIEAGEHLT